MVASVASIHRGFYLCVFVDVQYRALAEDEDRLWQRDDLPPDGAVNEFLL